MSSLQLGAIELTVGCYMAIGGVAFICDRGPNKLALTVAAIGYALSLFAGFNLSPFH